MGWSCPVLWSRFRQFLGLLEFVVRTRLASSCRARCGVVVVVVAPPFFDPIAGVGHRQEPRCIEALRPHATINASRRRCPWAFLAVRSRFRRRLDRPIDRASDRRTPGHCRAKALRLAARADQLIENLDHLERPEVRSRSDRERFSGVAVDDRQNPERPTIEELHRS